MLGHKSRPTASASITDLLTYRYDGKLVYVPVAPDYHEALVHARDAFPQLKHLQDASLELSMPGQAKKVVGISAPAWPKLIPHLARYQIIDVLVAQERERPLAIPNITITYADAEDRPVKESAPPAYSGSDSDSAVVQDEKVTCSTPPSPPRTLSHKRSWLFQRLHG